VANQYLWIGITIGVFLAGLGIGYAINQYTVTPNMMTQNMQHMMQNPDTRQQMMNQWMQNPDTRQQMMNQWMQNPNYLKQMHETMMNDPQHMEKMHEIMEQNPQHMQQMMKMMGPQMMGMMVNDTQMRQQMIDTMMQNRQFIQGMMTNPQFQQNWTSSWVNNTSGMMGSGMTSHNMMMGKPITKNNDVINTVKNIENLLDQISIKYKSGDKDTAFSLASTAYLENYEYIEGTIASKNRQLMEKTELMLRVDLRNLIKNESPQADIDSKIDSIKGELEKVKSLFK